MQAESIHACFSPVYLNLQLQDHERIGKLFFYRNLWKDGRMARSIGKLFFYRRLWKDGRMSRRLHAETEAVVVEFLVCISYSMVCLLMAEEDNGLTASEKDWQRFATLLSVES